MTTITTDQAMERWDTLPVNLREALYSEPSTDFLWKTCEDEHIPDENIYDVSRIAGYVLMGFLHPGDMAGELKDQLNMDPKTAATIAAAVNERVFAPLRQDIDKIYAPISKLGPMPKIVQEIKPGPQIISQTMTGAAIIGAVPLMANQMKAAAPPPAAPVKLPDVGWSKSTPAEPVVRLSQAAPSPIQANAIPAPKPAPSPMQKPLEAKTGLGEFERMTMQQQPKAPSAPSAPTAAPAPAMPGPVIIHEDAVFKPTAKTPDFHIQMSPEKFGGQSNVPPPPPMRSAVLELGKAAPTPLPKPPSSAPRVVHYTEYKPSTQTPGAPQAPRQVTEMTSPTPVAPSPIPAPPSASTKMIYKDYNEPPSPPPAKT